MKRYFMLIMLLVFCASSISCAGNKETEPPREDDTELTAVQLAEENLRRSMNLISNAKKNYFAENQGMAMSRYYNPFGNVKSHEKGSVWMYTSAIEAVNALLHGMIELKEAGSSILYDNYFGNYVDLLSSLVDNLEYYAGTYTLISYTQTKEWTVYGVNRGNAPGQAKVAGIENVYDDQQWLIKELLEAYKITGEKKYFDKAEYLAEYVLDGWDCTLDVEGKENGGIVWGPGYYTKHSCSNGPFISPLVTLAEYYADKNENIEYRYIGADKKRLTKTMYKGEYYLMFAKKVYDFQKKHLYNKSDGVYFDMLGADGFNGDNIAYETVDGIKYRAHNKIQRPVGRAYSYNTGTMLSGAADLYRITKDQVYLNDMTSLSTTAFRYFAKTSSKEGLYEYAVDGFNNWFNGVLLRGWVDVSFHYSNVGVNVNSFQANLDYAYENYLKSNMLPNSLLFGWNTDHSKNKVEAMFTFAYAAEYAVLAKYHLNK